MNILYRVGILIVLLLFSVVSTSAASACSAQPANADGTTITSPTPDQVVTSPFTIQGMYFGSFEGVVPIQLLDENGTEILRVNAMNECCVLAAYQRQVTFRNVSSSLRQLRSEFKHDRLACIGRA